jgi:hypothetical protein
MNIIIKGLASLGIYTIFKQVFSEKRKYIAKEHSIQEWRKIGGYDLEEGYYVVVLSETYEDVKYYVFAHNDNLNVVECTCPAWRYQKIRHEHRSCKHCRAVLGIDADNERINQNLEDYE